MTLVIVSKDSIKTVIEVNADNPDFLKQYVGRALVVLFDNQTRTEQSVNSTQVWNGIGFTSGDAHSGSLTAKSFLKNKTLADWQLARWTKLNPKGYPRLAKYHRQLNEAALKKREKMMESGVDTNP